MFRCLLLALLPPALAVCLPQPLLAQAHPPLRVGIVGLVHGHVHGFREQSSTTRKSMLSASQSPTVNSCRRPPRSTDSKKPSYSLIWRS